MTNGQQYASMHLFVIYEDIISRRHVAFQRQASYFQIFVSL